MSAAGSHRREPPLEYPAPCSASERRNARAHCGLATCRRASGIALAALFCGERGRAAVPVQMWQRRAQSRRRCGRGEPSPSADVPAVSPVPAQMWQGRAQSRRRCGSAIAEEGNHMVAAAAARSGPKGHSLPCPSATQSDPLAVTRPAPAASGSRSSTHVCDTQRTALGSGVRCLADPSARQARLLLLTSPGSPPATRVKPTRTKQRHTNAVEPGGNRRAAAAGLPSGRTRPLACSRSACAWSTSICLSRTTPESSRKRSSASCARQAAGA